ncbi:MAG: hypothetical protein KDC87_06185, partial [Planctomycetes bacterium]|nr:hypothetical protein [Planctomycetota bacterium]
MKTAILLCGAFAVSTVGAPAQADRPRKHDAGPRLRSQGLHGYIRYRASRPPRGTDYGAGIGFYSAVWPLIDKPLARF